MNSHVYVDETKHGDYIMVAASVAPRHLGASRQAVRGLMLPKQRRLHMKDEKESRRKEILDVLAALPITAVVYTAGRRYANQSQRRAACLQQIVRDSAFAGSSRLVIERDESLVSSDRQLLIESVRQDLASPMEYLHCAAHEDVLLGIPDAIAWCWARGGHWRQRVEPVVQSIVDV